MSTSRHITLHHAPQTRSHGVLALLMEAKLSEMHDQLKGLNRILLSLPQEAN